MVDVPADDDAANAATSTSAKRSKGQLTGTSKKRSKVPDFDERAKSIAAEFRMISGCEDKQTSDDVVDVLGDFDLPDPAGRAGGACTSAFLNIAYADQKAPEKDLSFKDILLQMRSILVEMDYEQIPQLSSSRPMSVETKFDLTPEGFTGTKRAVLIGINYVGQRGELSGCHNDVLNMKEYLIDVHGFEEKNMTILMDDGVHPDPTRSNILDAYEKIVSDSQSGDVVFCHYSGHGSKKRDRNKDEADKYDETLVPLDYRKKGQILDDDLLKKLVLPMAAGVFVSSIMDCCHSGTVFDLPYNFKADGKETDMKSNEGFAFDPIEAILAEEATSNGKPPKAIRIVAAVIDPKGADRGNEKVTLKNVSDGTVDITNWNIVDKSGRKSIIDAMKLESGEKRTITLSSGAQLVNSKDGKIMLINDNGDKIDEVSYTPSEVKDGDGIVEFH